MLWIAAYHLVTSICNGGIPIIWVAGMGLPHINGLPVYYWILFGRQVYTILYGLAGIYCGIPAYHLVASIYHGKYLLYGLQVYR